MAKTTARKAAYKFANVVLDSIELLLIDLAFGKGKYRKRGPQPRMSRTVYRERVIIRSVAPRLVVVDEDKRVQDIR